MAEHFTSYKLDKATIANDLSSKERPPWILSAYGPGTRAPIQLFGGYPREQSFEELRLRHYELAIQGNHQTAIEEAQLLVNNAEQQIQAALNDVDGAIKYVINGENQHPNRIDMTNLKGNTPRQPQGLSQNQQTASFGGTTSGLSSAPITFGTPSGPTFGPPNLPPSNSAQSQTSTFGQPSSFGQPAALGRPTTSFGQPSSTFGKPSMVAPTFSQPSGPSPFSAPTNPSPFAPSSGTGANQQSSSTVNHASSILGQSSAPQANPFSQPAAPFQSNVFGRPSNPNPGNPFARPAQAGQDTSSAPNPFSQPTASTTAQSFGLPSTTASSSFGLPSKILNSCLFDLCSLSKSFDYSTASPSHSTEANANSYQSSGLQLPKFERKGIRAIKRTINEQWTYSARRSRKTHILERKECIIC